MLAKEALKGALRTEFGPLLRSLGFRGAFPTWRLQQGDDVAVVDIQPGRYNEGDFGDFYVNLAIVPAAWWAWTHECAGDTPWGSDSPKGRAREWDGLYRARSAPDDGQGRSDAGWPLDGVEEAATVAARMTSALPGALDPLLELLRPGRLLDAMHSGLIDDQTPLNDRPGMRDIVRAVLLTEVGGTELQEACQRLDSWAGHDFAELPLATASWARRRGASLGGSAP
ncbi:DUF4304 domain-containing protein [Knoellia sp. 3-2P3]|uniref:DUF4304 domain-containing protein n=1 Tax=unclassified Knoellia TaxID=2618719 RepID=UPI0023DC739B|nr:DUF4304 domain-containing protein [Knoellia sp. 3-2P3]MDF2091605.1 DUF4304 domain-containing protein [Knoellia sp. 3-2P3]